MEFGIFNPVNVFGVRGVGQMRVDWLRLLLLLFSPAHRLESIEHVLCRSLEASVAGIGLEANLEWKDGNSLFEDVNLQRKIFPNIKNVRLQKVEYIYSSKTLIQDIIKLPNLI